MLTTSTLRASFAINMLHLADLACIIMGGFFAGVRVARALGWDKRRYMVCMATGAKCERIALPFTVGTSLEHKRYNFLHAVDTTVRVVV